MKQKNALGEILIQKKLITPDQLKKALKLQVSGSRRLGYILVKMKVIAEENLVDALTDQKDIHSTQLDNGIEETVKKILPRYLCVHYSILPISIRHNRILKLAMVNPLDTDAIVDIENYTGHLIEPVLIKKKDLEKGIRTYIPFQLKDVIVPFKFNRSLQIISLFAFFLFLLVMGLSYNQYKTSKYGKHQRVGQTEIFSNHEIMVGQEGRGAISLIGHSSVDKGFYSFVFNNYQELKDFIEHRKSHFSNEQYNWLIWLINNNQSQ